MADKDILEQVADDLVDAFADALHRIRVNFGAYDALLGRGEVAPGYDQALYAFGVVRAEVWRATTDQDEFWRRILLAAEKLGADWLKRNRGEG